MYIKSNRAIKDLTGCCYTKPTNMTYWKECEVVELHCCCTQSHFYVHGKVTAFGGLIRQRNPRETEMNASTCLAVIPTWAQH